MVGNIVKPPESYCYTAHATNGIDIMLVVASENIAMIPRNNC
ncbi:MAG: hypothetical protein ACJ71H_12105 [Nitrososphaeraceae archaeon]